MAAPPTRDGVGASCVGVPPGTQATVLDFLERRFAAQPRAVWQKRIERELVLDEGGTPLRAAQSCLGLARLFYYRECDDEPLVPFTETVLYQDAHLLVADKPHFLPVIPAGAYLQQTLLVRLKRRLGLDSLVPIHRIDRDTAGLVMFSLQAASRDAYQALFRLRRVQKTYEAVAPLRPELALPLVRRSRIGPGAHFMQQREIDGDANATTQVELLQRMGTLGLYRLRPVSGYRHQLRVHMAALGIPIVGDGIYPVLTPPNADLKRTPLQLLARSLCFTDPLDGRPRRFESLRRLDLAQTPSPDCGPH